MSVEHKARYLLDRFLSSEHSYEFDLDAYDIATLYMITRYLDMPRGICCAKQITLARECRMSERHFRRSTEKLHKLNIIIRYYNRKLYHYELGSVINGLYEI